jgi:hypothetical protein
MRVSRGEEEYRVSASHEKYHVIRFDHQSRAAEIYHAEDKSNSLLDLCAM